MAKKVEIVALVSVLGQPSYDKSRWANFFGEKLAKVTKGKDKIAAINAGASLFKKFVASIKDLDKQYSLKNVTVAAKALAMSADAAETNAEYSAKMRRWLRAAPSCDKAEDVIAHVGDMEDAGFTPVDDDGLKKLFEDEEVKSPAAKRPKTEDAAASGASAGMGQPVASAELLVAVKALNTTIDKRFVELIAAIKAHSAAKEDAEES